MAKFFGYVGFLLESVESKPGVWTESIVERSYRGDVLRNAHRYSGDGQINKDIVLNNQISVVFDQYFIDNVCFVRYVFYMGAYWTVTNVEVQRPRLILTLGGAYNGPKADRASRNF